MTNTDIGNTQRTREIIKKYGIHAKKGFGQNFLTDHHILVNIVEAAQIDSNDNVIEIGPGLGALTEQLAKRAGQVVALEIDQDLIPVLDDVLAPYHNVKVVNQDILKANLTELIHQYFDNPQAPIKVVANLPYYITSPILMHLLNSSIDWSAICVMMQREVADRLTAKVGTKQYGSLTLAIEYSMVAKLAFGVSRHSFVPAPNVDSAIVVLTPRTKALTTKPFDKSKLLGFIKACFAHRRKNLWNNLKPLVGKDKDKQAEVKKILNDLQIPATDRPETLTLDQFIVLANHLHQQSII